MAAPTFVGRAEELAMLAQAITSPPAVTVIEGEAGIGKTRLVNELRGHPELAGCRFVVGAGRRIREPFPLGPLIDAVRGLADALAPGRLSAVAGALRPLLPELTGVLPAAPEPLADRAAERHRVFRALVEVLGSVGPAVLVVEDAHWADEHTVDFLSYLFSQPPPELAVLITFRGDEVDPAVRTLTAALPGTVAQAHVVLPALDGPQTGALAAAILELDRVSEEFASYLRDRAAGLPFVIEELLALMQARGVLARRDGEWVRRAIDELDVPAGVRDPVLERFSRLGPDAQAVAEAAAVLQVPTPAAVLVATSRLAESRALQGVDEALRSGLLAEQPGGASGPLGFRHLLAAQAIYEGIPGPRRQHLHARAAAALAALDPVPLGQRAHHLRQAGQLTDWLAAAEQAADQALALGHGDEAVRLLEDVLREARPAAEHRGRLAVKLARAAHQALHFGEEVLELLSGVLEQDLPRELRGEVRLRMGALLERTGADVQRQQALLSQAVDELVDRPELRAHAMAGLGIPRISGMPLAEHLAWLRRVLEVVPEVGDPALRVSLLGKVAMVRVAVGDPQWREQVDQVLALTGGVPRQPAELSAFHSAGASACYAGHLATADQLLAAVLAGGTAAEGSWREVATRATLALLDYCRGRWDGLAARVGNLADQLVDHAPGRADAEVVAGCLALASGELEQAGEQLCELAQRLVEWGAFDVLPMAAGPVLRWTVGQGDTAAAAEQGHRFLAVVESVPPVVSTAWLLPALTDALVAGGDPDQARALVQQWQRRLRDLDAPLAEAALPYAWGILAAGAGRWGPAASQLVAAAAGYDRLGCPYEAALARERAGAALLQTGDGPAGAAQLQAALTALQQLGASWDLDRASRTARQYAVPVPARHRRGRRGYGEALSPRERDVAELAALGRRDKEIAEQLFLSPSTVRKHLSAAMRKLAVSSRTALAHQLARDRQPRQAEQ